MVDEEIYERSGRTLSQARKLLFEKYGFRVNPRTLEKRWNAMGWEIKRNTHGGARNIGDQRAKMNVHRRTEGKGQPERYRGRLSDRLK